MEGLPKNPANNNERAHASELEATTKIVAEGMKARLAALPLEVPNEAVNDDEMHDSEEVVQPTDDFGKIVRSLREKGDDTFQEAV